MVPLQQQLTGQLAQGLLLLLSACGRGVADCVREYCEPSAGAGDGTAQRVRDSRGGGGEYKAVLLRQMLTESLVVAVPWAGRLGIVNRLWSIEGVILKKRSADVARMKRGADRRARAGTWHAV